MDVFDIARKLGITLLQRNSANYGQMIHRQEDGVHVTYNAGGTLLLGDGMTAATLRKGPQGYLFIPPGVSAGTTVASLDDALRHWPEQAAPRARKAFAGALA
jgi:hypothetical protein